LQYINRKRKNGRQNRKEIEESDGERRRRGNNKANGRVMEAGKNEERKVKKRE
jgi:hypothetical protein